MIRILLVLQKTTYDPKEKNIISGENVMVELKNLGDLIQILIDPETKIETILSKGNFGC